MVDEEVIGRLIAESEKASISKLGVVTSEFKIRWLAEVAASLIDGVSAGYIRALPEVVPEGKKRGEPL